VDLERFRRERPYDPGGPLVAVGRLVPQKGFDTLVRAAALARERIPEVVIAGDGPLRGELERLIHELAAPVRLLGATPHAAVGDLLERASAAVLPSVIAPDGSRDSVPVVMHEALALGLPVVVSAVCGLPERIEPAHGALVAPGDEQALADALAALCDRPAGERAEMGAAARRYAEDNLSLRSTTGRLLALIDERLKDLGRQGDGQASIGG
jgi:glycosyltransferase involved in cell wall biosynthesis